MYLMMCQTSRLSNCIYHTRDLFLPIRCFCLTFILLYNFACFCHLFIFFQKHPSFKANSFRDSIRYSVSKSMNSDLAQHFFGLIESKLFALDISRRQTLSIAGNKINYQPFHYPFFANCLWGKCNIRWHFIRVCTIC